MLGVFVSDTGIRSRSFFSTETVPWSSVADIRNGAGGNEGFNPGRDAIHIHLTDGTEIVTPVRRGNRLPPRLFRIEVGRVVMWPKPYDDALILLRRQLAEARRAAAA
ncbi:PH domain-containing protein [Phytohabitans aurantiacus]|uniref:Low molecular weight protein antigen 6 PH domain-containing protein n=1 Tax=Phytohabitans aurantiacus TaxID=3016789 RepID=A0ABQ5R182_9ACTN|nr:PH domain-containing protein [Phytohabitans aurantiacus]GLI00564.1 hypothetical protein Pa4123_58400 [Phytohabitans aurantiacus]